MFMSVLQSVRHTVLSSCNRDKDVFIKLYTELPFVIILWP